MSGDQEDEELGFALPGFETRERPFSTHPGISNGRNTLSLEKKSRIKGCCRKDPITNGLDCYVFPESGQKQRSWSTQSFQVTFLGDRAKALASEQFGTLVLLLTL